MILHVRLGFVCLPPARLSPYLSVLEPHPRIPRKAGEQHAGCMICYRTIRIRPIRTIPQWLNMCKELVWHCVCSAYGIVRNA